MAKLIYTDEAGRQYVKSQNENENQLIDKRGHASWTGWMGYYSSSDIKSFKRHLAVNGNPLEDFVENFIRLAPQMGNVPYGFLIFSNPKKKHGYGIRKIVSVRTELE